MLPKSVAILNGDDDILREFNPGMQKITYGLDEYNYIRAENVETTGTGKVSFDVVSNSRRYSVDVSSYGSHLVMAALAAAAAGQLLGLTDDEISRGLLSYVPIDGRAKVTDTGHIILIDDCYNANPNSVMSAITSLSALPNRRVAILGDMLDLGVLSNELHHEIGSFAAQSGIDCLICNGEKAAFIYEGYMSTGGHFAKYFPVKADLTAAIPKLIKKDDAVLVKASNGMKFDEFLPILNGL
jgi:UDP-N-acetylmuramoyl-tripeptide--D-alanyl-D-alanine ligase